MATVRPSQLLSGKVVGIGVCGLGQLGIAVIAGLLTNALVQSTVIPSTVWVLLPAILPQLLVGVRITVGIAWLVVVAAEMIAVNSGLGFLIIDARNAGNRYDLVLAGMVLIGLIGVALDALVRRAEQRIAA